MRMLNDSDLLDHLVNMAADLRASECALLELLAEVEERRLFAPQGYSSMFAFCTSKLAFAEGTTCRRLAAARAARKYPGIYALLRAGSLHVTAVAMLAPLLDDSNHGELLAKAQGLGKRELETLLSGIAPRPPQRDVIRPVASPKPKAPPAAALKFDAPADEEKGMISTGAATGETPAASRCDVLPERQETPLRLAGMTSDTCTTRQTLSPATPELVQISFAAKAELAKKLRRAQDLLAHRLPDGRLEDVFDAALQALLERVDPLLRAKRRAAREEKRRQKHDDKNEQSQTSSCPGPSRVGDVRTQARAPFDTAAQQAPSSQDCPCPATPPSTDAQAQAPLDPSTAQSRAARRRSFPAAERYAIWERDQCCTFVGADGKRCNETRGLEIDHCRPWALGGASDRSNGRLLCRTHNAWRAQVTFGPRRKSD
jgi:hypothetical protein